MAGLAKLVLLEEYKRGAPEPDLDALRLQLQELPGFDDVELVPHGRSGVVASVPADSQRDEDRLKALVNEHLEGWSVLEESSYALPRTF